MHHSERRGHLLISQGAEKSLRSLGEALDVRAEELDENDVRHADQDELRPGAAQIELARDEFENHMDHNAWIVLVAGLTFHATKETMTRILVTGEWEDTPGDLEKLIGRKPTTATEYLREVYVPAVPR